MTRISEERLEELEGLGRDVGSSIPSAAEQIELVRWYRAETLRSIARSLSRALVLGQRGFGRQGDPLPDIDKARALVRELLLELGEKP